MIKNIFKRTNSQKETFKQRRSAVAPQRFEYDENIIKTITKYPKSKEDEMFIRSAIENNDFLFSLLQNKKLQDVIDSMYPKAITPNQTILKQGEDGSHLYISIIGTYEVIQDDETIQTFSDVRVFGELALLYNSKRIATIKARSSGKIFILDRIIFKYLMVKSDIEEREETINFLKQVPKLNTVPQEVLNQVVPLLKREFFPTGSKIIREGDRNPDRFYIIKAGSVTVSKQSEGCIDRLYRGSCFGELGLMKEQVRKATITADPPGTECLILSRNDFIAHFGNIPDCFSINIQTQPYKPIEELMEHTDLNLGDFKVISTLGIGSFGRVELIQHKIKNELVFALKSMQKKLIVAENHQEHVYNEKNVQINCKNNFIVRLYRTYRDSKFLYFLLEPCLGSDLWSLLQRKKLQPDSAKFYAACVLQAFEYLHSHQIIYRDLKPENLLIDSKGYAKLANFGYAKKLQFFKKTIRKTYTFVGTPEYVPPEILLNQGHDQAVDFWALGIFIFELLVGQTPFKTDDTSYMKTYKLILKGVDDLEFGDLTPESEDLVKKLCKMTPSDRLGCLKGGIMDIKKHEWFEGFKWEELETCKLVAPFRPNLRNNIDVHYFETFPKNCDIAQDDNSGWDENF